MQLSEDPRFDLHADTEHTAVAPLLTVIGEEGIGKTTFAANAQNGVIIPTESGALRAPGADRLPRRGKCESWEEVIGVTRLLLGREHPYEWVAIDTIDEAEALCTDMVCRRDFGGLWTTKGEQRGFEDYGLGEKAVAHELRQLLALLEELRDKKGVGIILLSHEGIHRQGTSFGPEHKLGGGLNRSTWHLVSSWSDQIGHACRYNDPDQNDGTATDVIGKRCIVFEGGPGRSTKARVGFEMPTQIPLSWNDYIEALTAPRGAP